MNYADLVSEMPEREKPFQSGTKAQRGFIFQSASPD